MLLILILKLLNIMSIISMILDTFSFSCELQLNLVGLPLSLHGEGCYKSEACHQSEACTQVKVATKVKVATTLTCHLSTSDVNI